MKKSSVGFVVKGTSVGIRIFQTDMMERLETVKVRVSVSGSQ